MSTQRDTRHVVIVVVVAALMGLAPITGALAPAVGTASAQSTQDSTVPATYVGNVVDSNDDPVSGATVTGVSIRTDGTEVQAESDTTDDNGDFTVEVPEGGENVTFKISDTRLNVLSAPDTRETYPNDAEIIGWQSGEQEVNLEAPD